MYYIFDKHIWWAYFWSYYNRCIVLCGLGPEVKFVVWELAFLTFYKVLISLSSEELFVQYEIASSFSLIKMTT